MDYVWKDYFTRRNLQPAVVTYEDLVARPREMMAELYRFIKGEELSDPEKIVIRSDLEIQRDSYSEEIQERFLEDIDHLGAPEYWASCPEQTKHWKDFFSTRDWVPKLVAL